MTTQGVLICVLIAVVATMPAQGVPGVGWAGPSAGGWGAGNNPWMLSWLSSAPWLTSRTSCIGIGSSCVDCSTKLVCTKVGGIQRACSDPALPYCNLGECSAIPATGCKA